MPKLARDGATIEYDVAGNGSRALVFSHNLLTDRSVWDALVARFRDRFRCVNVDSRGHGASRTTRAFTVVEVAHDLLAVLDALAIERATIIGCSLGSTAALELALARPERVDGLVLLAPNPLSSTAGQKVQNVASALAIRLLGSRPFILSQAIPVLYGKSFRAAARDVVAERARRLYSMPRLDAARAISAWTWRPPLIDRLDRIRARSLIIVGEEDVAHPPPLGELARSKIAGATIARVAAGHTIPLERPRETGDLIEAFLAG